MIHAPILQSIKRTCRHGRPCQRHLHFETSRTSQFVPPLRSTVPVLGSSPANPLHVVASHRSLRCLTIVPSPALARRLAGCLSIFLSTWMIRVIDPSA